MIDGSGNTKCSIKIKGAFMHRTVMITVLPSHLLVNFNPVGRNQMK